MASMQGVIVARMDATHNQLPASWKYTTVQIITLHLPLHATPWVTIGMFDNLCAAGYA
jgi:hypothetical protein